jgi:V/A-type H+-transporting ATPase subunit F
MDKIAVMGDYDSIYGFAALGLSTFPVDNLETAKKRLSTLVNSGYGIIYVTEELARMMSDKIDEYKSMMSPAIILIPGVKGNTGEGILSVRKSVEQAVGSDILFSK